MARIFTSEAVFNPCQSFSSSMSPLLYSQYFIVRGKIFEIEIVDKFSFLETTLASLDDMGAFMGEHLPYSTYIFHIKVVSAKDKAIT